MPSPFPGMDPFVESQEWSGFHARFLIELADRLVPQVRPKYVIDPEKRIYVETQPDEPRLIRPDVAVLQRATDEPIAVDNAAIATIEPIAYTLQISEEQRETYLVVRDAESREVVTVIEVLSPGNKRSGSDGRREYLDKRQEVLASKVNLVEIDLLRGGLRCPTVEALRPSTDYCALICRRGRRPRAEVYEWPLQHILPAIPIPLGPGDPDVSLDLQAAVDAVYDRAGYDYALRYSEQLHPPLRESDAGWVAEILSKVR